jgi:hypothetical protein
VPGEYALFQAYPNPCNPATTIRYQLPYESRVTLRVYSLLGEAIAALADEIQPAGYRCIQWNASGCASGVYFYRIEAVRTADPGTSFTDVKKILLLR